MSFYDKLNDVQKEHIERCGAGAEECKEGTSIFIVCCGCGKALAVFPP